MAGLDPITAREGLRTAREIISGRQVSYPVPYLAVILACLCVGCLIIAVFASDMVKVLASAIAGAAAVFLMAMIAYAFALRPDLLRSERHELTTRLIDIVGDKETTPAVRDRLSQTLLALEGPNKRGRDLQNEDSHHAE